MKSGREIREAFLSYFENRGHQRIKSSSLVPGNDPTLLFTNAGMNQFKDVFLGLEQPAYRRAVSSQKCMRVSGKHNDLEMVGRTSCHHTFFEMLGNFSFGDYFKLEAIEFAWEVCTRVYELDSENLVVTVYEQDEEAFKIWRDHIGVPADKLFQCGAEDNFWAMGETGPCGPCSEIHFDMGSRTGDSETPFGIESDRFFEIWNLVFMQFNRDASGQMTPLPSPSIDTGMGLERIACVLQGVTSNYETDLFKPLIQEAGRLTGVAYGQSSSSDVSLKILADHSRASMFLIADGVVPGNEGREYVLRKILRRAIRHGKMLGQKRPFIFTLTSLVAELMADAYPELTESREYAAKVVKNEEEKFHATLSHGMTLLEDILAATGKEGKKVISGQDLFRLYDTYGFPLDLIREIAHERRFDLDETGFDRELQKQRERARAGWKGSERTVKSLYAELASRGFETEFTGYDSIEEIKGKVLAIVRDDKEAQSLKSGQIGEVVLDRTPFYAEAGGQVADRGRIANETMTAELLDVYTPVGGLRFHKVKILEGELTLGASVRSSVIRELRRNTANNHTATHLLHAALREVLGEHVKQAGSLVAPERLRFDFTHFKALTAPELGEIEELVNRRIQENISLQTEIKDLEEALREGAMALFGEKYDQSVRVVKIPGVSIELCGGTHVKRTGDISLFKIVSENSISSGVRRVEAITGPLAVSRFVQNEEILEQICRNLHVPREEAAPAVEKVMGELKEAHKQIERLRLQLAQKESSDALAVARDIKGVRVYSQKVESLDRDGLRRLASQIKNKLRSGVVVLGTPVDGSVNLVAMVTPDLTDRIKADQLIRRIASIVGGGGGGKADMAEAGGKYPAALEKALEEAYRLVDESL